MEEKDIQLTEKEMQRMFDRIMEDDTHWDLMTGSLLTRRLKSYFKDTMSQTTFVEAMNCLRLTDLVYLYSQEGDSITMPTVPAPEGLTIMLFTSKRKITQARHARWEFHPQTISWYRKLSVCFWKRFMNPHSQPIPMASAPSAPAIPRCPKSKPPSQVSNG